MEKPKAAIVCRSSIMKGAIASSFAKDGITYIEGNGHADVGVIISGLLAEQEADEKCIAQVLQGVKASKWVVLGRKSDDPIYRHLVDKGCDPCMVPEDIDAEDLCHVVRLASSGHVVSMGKFCRDSHPEDARRLSSAGLGEDQWRLLGHLSMGLSNKEIAIEEETTEAAIKARLRCLLRKIGLNNRTKAAVLAARCGIGIDHNKHVETA